MRALQAMKRPIGNSDRSAQLLSELREGTANQSSLLNEKLNAVILGIEHQAELLNSRLKELAVRGNDPRPRPEVLNSDPMLELLRRIRDGISNETKVMQEKMAQLVQGIDNQLRLLNKNCPIWHSGSNCRVAAVIGEP